MAPRRYDTDHISVTYDAQRCIHARRCVLALPRAFVEGRGRDWIDPAGADPDAVATVIHQCPSGALQYTRRDGGPGERPPGVNTAQLTEDGPLRLEGELYLGDEPIGTRATLCRCGNTGRPPFCDGSHTAAAFHATSQRTDGAPSPLDVRDGPVHIRPQPDGPLILEGNLEFIAGSGTTFATRTRVAVCRCGQSRNKPFCDGSHTPAGFRAPGG